MGFSVPVENNVIVKLIDMGSRKVLLKYRIDFPPESSACSPEDSVDFDIRENTIVPQENFISSFKVLGAAILWAGLTERLI